MHLLTAPPPAGSTAAASRRTPCDRKGTNGVSTNGVTAIFMFFDRGTFWVLPLPYFYLPKSARAHLFPQSVKIRTSAAASLVLTPFVRNQCEHSLPIAALPVRLRALDALARFLFLIDDLMRASVKSNLSELLRVSQRLSLALVIRHVLLNEHL